MQPDTAATQDSHTRRAGSSLGTASTPITRHLDAPWEEAWAATADADGSTQGLLGSRRAPRLPAGALLCRGRLRVLRCLGQGGMGTVYEVYDAAAKRCLALKTSITSDAHCLYRLKREFRTLQRISHPNIVRVHELFDDGGQWYFTMDRVRGCTLGAWLDERARTDAELGAAFGQLVAALAALHAQGRLHRDLKPANVLVTPEGRVVLIDLGLSAASELGGEGQTILDGRISGTVAYMAPEQLFGGAATPPTDCYALGVMLYEALGGVLPQFTRVGSSGEIQDEQVKAYVARPANHWLRIICDELLAERPAQRPTAAELQRRFGVWLPSCNSELPPAAPADSSAPIGECHEFESALECALAGTSGGPVILEPGLGPIAAWLEHLALEDRAVVLQGSASACDNVRYNAFDGLIDELSRYLRKLPRDAAAALLPRDACLLAEVFPVLQRVEVIAEAPVRRFQDRDRRPRVWRALQELLARIRDRHLLVLHFQDIQHASSESLELLCFLLTDSDRVPLLLVLSGGASTEGLPSALQRLLADAACPRFAA